MDVELKQLDSSGANDGDVVTFDSASGLWVPSAPGGGMTAAYISVYTDQSHGMLATKQALFFNGAHVSEVGWLQANQIMFCNQAGIYVVGFSVSIEEASKNDAEVQFWMEGSGSVEVPGSRCKCYHDGAQGESSASCTLILDLTADDAFIVYGQRTSGTPQVDTKVNGCQFRAYRIA